MISKEKTLITEINGPLWVASLTTCALTYLQGGIEAVPNEAAVAFITTFVSWSLRIIHKHRNKKTNEAPKTAI